MSNMIDSLLIFIMMICTIYVMEYLIYGDRV